MKEPILHLFSKYPVTDDAILGLHRRSAGASLRTLPSDYYTDPHLLEEVRLCDDDCSELLQH